MFKKCYVLIISETFPKTHSKAGEKTGFFQNIMDGVKKHTFRGNYPLWKKRVDEIQAGRAYLSVRAWTGKPYASKQIELLNFDNVGIEKLDDGSFVWLINDKVVEYTESDFAKNDGLETYDFIEWFEKATYPLAIIHFTDFRYLNHGK